MSAMRGIALCAGLVALVLLPPAWANEIVRACYLGSHDEGIHLLGPLAQKVTRIAPPLVISEVEAQAAMKLMYHPSDLASMDPLVLMKNLDHVRMTSRRLSYILQQQVHLYTPEANQIREQIDLYVEAERQIEGEMARRRIRA